MRYQSQDASLQASTSHLRRFMDHSASMDRLWRVTFILHGAENRCENFEPFEPLVVPSRSDR
jgi:hypothetical protein